VTKRIARELTASDAEDGWMVRVDGVPFTGDVVDTEHGRVIGVTGYRDGLEHGPSVEYFPDGSKQVEGQSAVGYAVGEWREWYADGRLKSYKVLDRWGDLRKSQLWDADGVLIEDRESRGLHGGEW
jgi:antitoxin component YwqK of YwqJK toxin-antitoxin module